MVSKVLISQRKGKEKLVKAFEGVGVEIVNDLKPFPELIIPTVDEELPFFSLNKDWFKKKGHKVMVSNDYTLDMCRDKAEFYRFCLRHGFKTPATMQENLIIKPRFGKASKGVIKVDRSCVVQEDMSGFPEVSIDYFADWHGIPLSIIPRYRKDVVNGETQTLKLVECMDLTEVERLGKELYLIGHNVIQGFYTGKEFIFTEVNCRFGGGSHLTFSIFNSPKWLVENS